MTLEATGTMLLGTEIGAALTALEVYDVDAIGLNCATGPKEMNDAVRYLSVNSSKHVSVLPNAGLPQNVGGRAVYALTPAGVGRLSSPLRAGLRRAHRRRMLRHHARSISKLSSMRSADFSPRRATSSPWQRSPAPIRWFRWTWNRSR